MGYMALNHSTALVKILPSLCSSTSTCIYKISLNSDHHAALQEKKSQVQEAEILLQTKQAEFLQQIEQEKASTLTLLQVERQMWEAERNKQIAEKEHGTE